MVAGRFVARLMVFLAGAAGLILPPDDPNCGGCISSETPADSTIGDVFNDYGKAFQVQTESMAQKAGENTVFTEFVPIKYAWQRVAGIMFYVKVRVGEGQFADVKIYSSWDDAVPPVIQSVTLHVTEDAPISGTDAGPHANSLPQDKAQIQSCPGCRSDEMGVDANVAGLFHDHMDKLLPQSESLAQAQGMNAAFTELTPVRYAYQHVAGTMYFVKVQVADGLFCDLRIFQSFEIGVAPEVLDLVAGVGEEAPITDFASPAVAV